MENTIKDLVVLSLCREMEKLLYRVKKGASCCLHPHLHILHLVSGKVRRRRETCTGQSTLRFVRPTGRRDQRLMRRQVSREGADFLLTTLELAIVAGKRIMMACSTGRPAYSQMSAHISYNYWIDESRSSVEQLRTNGVLSLTEANTSYVCGILYGE
jgi:hypothetical protein